MANIEITELPSKITLNPNDLYMSKDQGDGGDYKITLNQITTYITDNAFNQSLNTFDNVSFNIINVQGFTIQGSPLATVATSGDYNDLQNIPDISIEYPVLASGSTATQFFTPDNESGNASYYMPTTPTDGQVVEWVAPPTLYSTNSLTFNVTDKNIEGDATELVWDLDGIGGKLVFNASADEWKAFKDVEGVV